MAFPRHTIPVHCLLKVGQVGASVASLRGHAWTLLLGLLAFSSMICTVIDSGFVFPVSWGSRVAIFSISAPRLLLRRSLLHFEG